VSVGRVVPVRSSQWVRHTGNSVLDKAVDRAMNSVRSTARVPAGKRKTRAFVQHHYRVRSEKNFSMKKKLLFLICSAAFFYRHGAEDSCCSHQSRSARLSPADSRFDFRATPAEVIQCCVSTFVHGFRSSCRRNKGALQYSEETTPRVSGRSSTDPLQHKPIYNKALPVALLGSRPRTGGRHCEDVCRHIRLAIAQTRIAFKVQPTGYGNGENLHRDYGRLQRADG